MSFEELLIRNAAETIMGIKCGSLLPLSQVNSYQIDTFKVLEENGLMAKRLRKKNRSPLLFLYRKEMLENILSERHARRILSYFGYEGNAESCIEKLTMRFDAERCPDEVGIFLGYPPEDVEMYIINGGKGYKDSALWKVYTDEEKAKRVLEEVLECRKRCSSLYEECKDIRKLIDYSRRKER